MNYKENETQFLLGKLPTYLLVGQVMNGDVGSRLAQREVVEQNRYQVPCNLNVCFRSVFQQNEMEQGKLPNCES